MTAPTIREGTIGEQAELSIFRARCLARARQDGAGEIDPSAVGSCRQLAQALRLVISIGQGAVQAIMAETFGDAEGLIEEPRGVAASIISAAEDRPLGQLRVWVP
jgi:hypothetical protein